MVHVALLLMLETASADLVSTISLKRRTPNLLLSTSRTADYPISMSGFTASGPSHFANSRLKRGPKAAMDRHRFDHLIGEDSEFNWHLQIAEQDLYGSSVPFKTRPRSAQHSNRPNHQQPEWKHPQARNCLQSQSRHQQHCRPSTRNSSSAVPRSTTHTIGGKGVAKAPMASEMPAMAKARASRFLENLRVFEIGVPALLGCFLGSVGGGVIWVWSAVIANSFVIWPLGRLIRSYLNHPMLVVRIRTSAFVRSMSE
jgi:hypothetical protein